MDDDQEFLDDEVEDRDDLDDEVEDRDNLDDEVEDGVDLDDEVDVVEELKWRTEVSISGSTTTQCLSVWQQFSLNSSEQYFGEDDSILPKTSTASRSSR
jgi:hypothetical protein